MTPDTCYSWSRMRIDENTPGSMAHEEAVRALKVWILVLYVVDSMICVFGGLAKGLSIPYAFWLFFQSLFFSYFVGFILLILILRYGRRLTRMPKMTRVSLLRFCVLFAFISGVMGGALVFHASPATPVVPADSSTLH
jgi:hypothetical protein